MTLRSLVCFLYTSIGKEIMNKKRNLIARKVRKALLEIPFYRKKLKEIGIKEHTVRELNNIEKLDRFLEKYGTFISPRPEDLIGKGFSSHLSLVNPEKRIWIQSSSGYTSIEKIIKKEDSLVDIAKKFRRKEVAYTLNDINLVLNEIYKPGLKRLFKDLYEADKVPNLGIFTRLIGIVSGSGIYPLVALSMLAKAIPTRVLYYGEPLLGRLPDYILNSIENDLNGIFVTPAILHEIGRFMIDNKLSYKNLRFVSMGGFKPSKKTIEIAHQIGAEMVIDGYSAQEVMPLGAIASGIISSENQNFPPMEGLMTYGNLVHLRVVDKNGENVSENEEGEIRITSPFEGTVLIDYPVGDITKLISYTTDLYLNDYNITLPFPLISWEIRRKTEQNIIKVREYPFSLNEVQSILSNYFGFNYVINVPPSRDKIYILLPNEIEEKIIKDVEEKVYFFMEPSFRQINIIEFVKLSKEEINSLVYPYNHHKPRNVLIDMDYRNLINELYKT